MNKQTVLHLLMMGASVSSYMIAPKTSMLRRIATTTTAPISPTSIQSNHRPEDAHVDVDFQNKDSRRSFLQDLITAVKILPFTTIPTMVDVKSAVAVENNDPLTDVYFGVGCFWHIQHEFIEAERKILGRSDKEITSRAGYAGGTQTKDGKVCYHNFQGFADYGKLGHGEVVGMTIPESNIGDFAKEYFSLFTKKGERVDPGDRGPEYRSLLGLPGGTKHPMYSMVEDAATAKGMTLEVGKGNDPDTLGKKMVYVMDTKQFPFYQGEVYHQFHDDFQSPPYGKAYNGLVKNAFDEGRVKDTGCPDRFPI